MAEDQAGEIAPVE